MLKVKKHLSLMIQQKFSDELDRNPALTNPVLATIVMRQAYALF